MQPIQICAFTYTDCWSLSFSIFGEHAFQELFVGLSPLADGKLRNGDGVFINFLVETTNFVVSFLLVKLNLSLN